MGTTPDAVVSVCWPTLDPLVCMRSVSHEGIRRSLAKGPDFRAQIGRGVRQLRRGGDQILFAGIEENLAEQHLIAGVESRES